jgi:hypothetical protein
MSVHDELEGNCRGLFYDIVPEKGVGSLSRCLQPVAGAHAGGVCKSASRLLHFRLQAYGPTGIESGLDKSDKADRQLHSTRPDPNRLLQTDRSLLAVQRNYVHNKCL